MNTAPQTESRSYRWPLFILLFLCFAGAILGDSTAEALLLSRFGAGVIPRMFLFNALFLVFSSSFIISAIDRIDRGLFFILVCSGHAVVLGLIRVAVMFGADFLYLPLFSYAYVAKILIFTLFWTLANDLIDSRMAGREFPVIASGGTLGAIIISFAIPTMLKFISAENLLIVWIGLAASGVALFIPLRARFGKAFMPRADRATARRRIGSLLTDLKLVRSEPLLWNMSIFYFILFFILLNQHFAFYQNLKARMPQADQLAGFLGYFTGVSMLLTFILQMTCAGFVLKKAGATRSMILLPAILCAVFGVSAWLGFTAGRHNGAVAFWAVVIGMGARIAFFDSFFSPNFQIFFSSLPQNVRGRGKFTIEGVIKPAVIVLSSFWLMTVASRLPFAVNMLILFAVAAGLCLQTLRIRKRYTDSLVGYLAGFKAGAFKAKNFNELANDDNFLAALAAKLHEEEFAIQRFIIEILADIKTDKSVRLLLDSLTEAPPRVRATIISALGGMRRDDVKDILVRHLLDKDLRVVANTVISLEPHADDPSVLQRLQALLDHPNSRIRANAIMALWKTAPADQRERLREMLVLMLYALDDRDSASALFVFGRIAEPDLDEELLKFSGLHLGRIMGDQGMWSRFVDAASCRSSEKLLRCLLLCAPGASHRQENDLAHAILRMITRGMPPHRLVRLLPDLERKSRSVVIRALSEREISLTAEDQGFLGTVIIDEIQHVYRNGANLAVLEKAGNTKGLELMRQVIREECIGKRINDIIYALALLDGSGQIRRIICRLHHEDRHVRARAFEVLDNMGNIRLNRQLTELLETNDAAALAQKAHAQYGVRDLSPKATLAVYAEDGNEWVRTCAQQAAACLA